jgi:hypothetical protein
VTGNIAIKSPSLKYTDPDGRTPKWATVGNAINLDFGRDYMNLARENFSEGEYGVATLMVVDAVSEAAYDLGAAYLGASVVGTLASTGAGILATSGDKIKSFFGGATKEIGQKAAQLPQQMHHFATNKNRTFTPQMEKTADKFGLKLNEAWNKMSLPHRGRHPNEYHRFVFSGIMEEASELAGGSKEKFIEYFNMFVVEPIKQSPDLLRKSGWE